MKNRIKISDAGNIESPLFQIIKEKGYAIKIINNTWIATKTNLEFKGENIVSLAGIILMYETKGNNWRVNDSIIDDYLKFLENNEV